MAIAISKNREKSMYKISARHILVIAMVSGLFAALGVLAFDRLSDRWQPRGVAFTESDPASITDPSLASDEQNNIQVYKAISPGVANIHSTSMVRDFFGMVEPSQGSGSGSVIDNQGNILTNYHVVERADKLTVSFGGDRNYPAIVVGGDPDTDLAVIRLTTPPKEPLTVIPLGD